MKNKLTKIAGVFLAALMLAGIISAAPVSVSAADPYLATGPCGDDAEWFLFDDGSIAIFGTGAIDSYLPGENGAPTSPWYSGSYQEAALFFGSKIAIEGGITEVGDYAFYLSDLDMSKYKNQVKNIDLTYSLTSIGRYAFYNQMGIQEITIPAGVTHIGANAFGGCTNLRTIRYYGNPGTLVWDSDGQEEFPRGMTVVHILTKYKDQINSYSELAARKNITFVADLELVGETLDDNIERNIKGYIGSSNTNVLGGAAPFVVVGTFDGKKKSVTYGSNGFACCVRIGDKYYLLTNNETGNLYEVTEYNTLTGQVKKVSTTPHGSLKLKISYEYVGVNTVKLIYTLTNKGATVSDVQLGGSGDIKIGADDKAAIQPIMEDDKQVGFYMRSGNDYDKAETGDSYATLGFRAVGVKKANSTETYPDAYFFYGTVAANKNDADSGTYRHIFIPERVFSKNTGSVTSGSFGDGTTQDSGMSFYWDAHDFANVESQEYAVLFSVYGTDNADTGEAMNQEMTATNYIVTWKNYDESVLLQQYVKKNDVPQYTGLTPERPLDSGNSYTFSGWNPEPAAVTGDATYTAKFDSAARLFQGHTLTLNGCIGVNYYLNPNIIHEGDTVRFDWFTKHSVAKIEASNLVTINVGGTAKRFYKITCNVAAAEMAYNIHAVAYINKTEYTKETDDYSVRQYGEVILDGNSSFSGSYKTKYGETKYNALVTLVKEMLNYGAKAQIRFDRIPDNPANINVTGYVMENVTGANITAQKSNMRSGTNDFGLDYKGTTVIYLTDTTLRHYYQVIDGADISAAMAAAKEAGFEFGEKDGLVYFQKQNIPAADLDTVYNLSFGSGSSYGFSVMDYSKIVLENNAPAAEKTLAAATYLYNRAANKFFI